VALNALGSTDKVRLDDDYLGNDILQNEFRDWIGELEVCNAALS
jgi:hypothetical protein